MSSRSNPSLLLAVLLLVLGAIVTFAIVVWDPTVGPTPVVVEPSVTQTMPTPVRPDEPLVDQPSVRTTAELVSLDTTVAFPFEVQIDLLVDQSLPQVPAGAPLGSGRTARLAGRISDGRNEGVRAEIRFTAGPNVGRNLRCDANGRFGASDLLPGIDIVEVSGPNIVGSRREVRLRQDKDYLLNIGYGRPAIVQGRVVDEDGKPVPGADVSLDGQVMKSDDEGTFYCAEVAAGRCLLEIAKEGFVAYRTELGVGSASRVEPGAISIVLRRPATMRLLLRPDIGGPEPALVYLMPSRTNYERNFPWHTVNPIELTGATPVIVHDLPEGAVHVRVYRSGAIATPSYRQVYLNAGVETEVVVTLEPAPVVSGAVFSAAGAVPGALVSITAADAARATQRHYATADDLWLEDVLPLMPATSQTVVADTSGRFRATSWSDLSPFRLLRAMSPDGKLGLEMLLGPEHDNVPLELMLVPWTEHTEARLVIKLPGRIQALPVRVAVDGQPRDEFAVPAANDVIVEGLRPGIYRIRATWQGERVGWEPELTIEREERLTWTLPLGAIEGQDEETWNKLGRVQPDVPAARERERANAAARATQAANSDG